MSANSPLVNQSRGTIWMYRCDCTTVAATQSYRVIRMVPGQAGTLAGLGVISNERVADHRVFSSPAWGMCTMQAQVATTGTTW